MPLTDPVPSSAFDVLERNIQDTDKFANQETGTFTNRVGKEIKPIPVIEAEANAAVISLGWHQVGLFADGFTYTLQNDIAKDSLGDWYRWNGALPKVVTAGILPSSDVNFVKIDYKSHAELSDRNPADGSAHNADDVANNKGGTVQGFIDAQYTTVTELATGKFQADHYVRLTDRDLGVFLIQSGGASDGKGVLSAGGLNTASLQSNPVTVAMFGDDNDPDVRSYASEFVRLRALKVVLGNNEIIRGSASNMLVRSVEDGQPNRIHQEPRSHISQGTVTKYDFMFDPYQVDPVSYRISSVFNEVGNLPNLNGENGRAVLNIKGAGQQFGVYPSWHLGFQDGARVPMKAFYYDTSDTEWRTPMMGAWKAGLAYNIGDYILSSFKLYKATTSGIAGATAPSHYSGTVDDGVVSWEFIRDYQAAVASFDTCVIFGDVDDMPLFGQFDIPVQYHGHTVHKFGFRDKWLKSDGTTTLAWTGVRSDSSSYQIEMADGSTTQFFEGWRRAVNSALSLGTQVIATNSGTVDIANKEKITFSNTVATNVSIISNPRVNQILYIEATNSNTTLVHNAQIRLKGGVNLPLTAESMVILVRHSDGKFVQV